ncbi:MAG: thymidylate kinase [Clostridia bacterium]|nr:thymidylate kinase [Clostridia bacterium]
MSAAKGRLLVIDGTDGSGKQTQTALLTARLQALGHPVKQLTFPTYSESSALIELYLSGQLGALGEVSPYAASTFYAVDRYASYRRDWGRDYEAGALVLTDRYVTANFIHQMSRLPRDRWEDYIAWLEELEYDRFGLPRPDAVFYLDLSPEASQRLLDHRYQGDPAKRDLHERDTAYLAACRETAQFAADRLGWHRIPCDRDGIIDPPEIIAARLEALARPYFPAPDGEQKEGQARLKEQRI